MKREREFRTYSAWVRACRKIGGELTVIEGDSDIAYAYAPGKPIGEWDGAVGLIYARSDDDYIPDTF